MTVEDNREYKKKITIKKPESVLSLFRLFKHVRPFFKHMVVIHIIGLVVVGINSVIPFSLKYLIEALQQEKISILVWVPPVALVFTALLTILGAIRQLLSTFISMKIGFNFQKFIYKKYIALDMLYHFGTSLGEKVSRITFDIQYLVSGATIFFSEILYFPVVTIVYIIIMVWLDWRLTLINLIIIPIVFLTSSTIGRKLKKTSIAIQKQNVHLSRHLIDTLRGINIVKAFRREDWEIARLGKILKEYLFHVLKDAAWRSLLRPSSRIVNSVFLCFIGWFAFYRITESGNLQISNFIAFISVMLLFQREMQKINSGVERLSRAAASLERIDEVLNIKTLLKYEGRKNLTDFRNSIVMKDIEFAYLNKPVLSNINLEIKKGEFITLSGLSGAGKTTLARILVGLLRPQKGQVLIDNISMENINLDSLRLLFSYVPQTTMLFYMTIRDNIAYGRPEATDDEIINAAKLACAHEFIENFPAGYDTDVGEMGERMSAGQRQRITIARALLVDTPIIVLDECFSNIDMITERRIYENLMSLQIKKTAVLITHRLSTIRDTDRIYHISNGHIEEWGTHEELIKLDGSYKNLFLMQEHLSKLTKSEAPIIDGTTEDG